MKKILFAMFITALLVSCSRTISDEKFVGAMVALGCRNATETSPEGQAILKEQGVTPDDIRSFRQEMDPNAGMKVAMEISRRVSECHGVKQ